MSSEGQSVLIAINLLGLSPQEALQYAIFLHLGTLIAVMVKFRVDIFRILTGSEPWLFRSIIIITLCTGITAVPMYFFIESVFTAGGFVTALVGALLIVTGLLLRMKREGFRDMNSLKTWELVALGLFQGCAILPGISRSGVTITTLLIRNIKASEALSLSFLISIPPVIGAIVLSGPPEGAEISVIIPMIGAACIIGYLMMDWLMKAAERISFSPFCIILGIITLFSALL